MLLKKGPYSILDLVVEYWVQILKLVARNFFKLVKVWPKKMGKIQISL